MRRNALSFLPRSRFSSTNSTILPAVIGSAPVYNHHLILHTPLKSTLWPARLESISPLFLELSQRKKFKELKVGITFAESTTATESFTSNEEESYHGTLYPSHTPIRTSPSTISAFEELHLSNLPPPSSNPSPVAIYVCTHNSRDCRCGEIGEPLYQSLVKEVKRRGIEKEVTVARIAHIGGHVYAGNVLLYRQGLSHDWYGMLRSTDAKELIDHALSTSTTPLYPYWRGSLTLSAETVKEQYLSSLSPSTPLSSSAKKELVRKPLGEKVLLIFEDVEGMETEIIGFEGESLMEVAKRGDLEAILATCGGHGECSTCHCHIDPLESPAPTADLSDSTNRKPISIPLLPPLPALSDTEDEQLDFALGRDENSRLACQIPVTKEFGDWVQKGGRIRLPEY